MAGKTMSNKSFFILLFIFLLIAGAIYALHELGKDHRKILTLNGSKSADSAYFVNADTSFHYNMDSLMLMIGRRYYPQHKAVSITQVRRILPFPCKVGDTIAVDYENAYYVVDSVHLYSFPEEEEEK